MRILRTPFRYAHLAWMFLWFAACVVMALIPGGHPPLIAFVPFVLAAALLGHLLLVIVAWLADVGRHRAGIADEARSGWPPETVVLALLLCGISIAATAFAIDNLPMLRNRLAEWSVLAAIAAGHIAAFLALMLRHGSARGLTALVASGWAVALALQLRESRTPGELVFGLAIIAALAGIAGWALRSERLRGFLS